ncbi:VCBS repeat-containing protein [Streptomyces sp. APSN-46.1]|uniref:FG-GAP repeat domain-containing protein n=1 Tax=Streptomyces sp. APSN-46.1 TaxID=2929049 RepID=UPI001FB2BE93|nr:VCBS repeat-containing protein [Streptomyces sp. APSN-46.1]MCJ1678983.1 VCBS repeat-containing protein [Streptomyces sp. APSN-46.1]
MRLKRSGRIAACTATALAAGMLLAGPASADGAPKPTTELQLPKVNMRGTGALPKAAPTTGTQQKQNLQRSADAPATATVGASVKPRFDVDGDGSDDLLYRDLGGDHYLKKSSNPTAADETINVQKADYDEDFKDLIPAGDLNHNGYPELLQLSITGQLSMVEVASTYLTNGVTWSSRGWNAYNKLIAAGDMTGDGNPDLLARTHGGALYLYPGTGRAGTDTPYGDRIQVGSGWGKFDQIIGGADYNADGIADVLATAPTGEMFFYAGTGNINSPFADGVQNGMGWTIYNQISPLVDGDGKTWVLARELSGTSYLYPSLGNGQLGDRLKFGTNWEYTSLLAGQGAIAAHGKGEVLGRSGSSLYGYVGKQNGNFADRFLIGEGGDFPSEFGLTLTSSMNKENAGDLLITYNGVLYGPQGEIGGGWDIYKSLLGVGDLDNDGYGDLLALDKSDVLWMYPSQGNSHNFASRIRVGGGWGIYNKLLGAGDITGDGRADLVVRGTDGALWVYPGTGSGTAPLTDRVKIGSGGWNGFNKLAAVGDITGDGRGDLMGVDSSGTAYRYSPTGLQGLNTFSGRGTIGTGWNTYGQLF